MCRMLPNMWRILIGSILQNDQNDEKYSCAKIKKTTFLRNILTYKITNTLKKDFIQEYEDFLATKDLLILQRTKFTMSKSSIAFTHSQPSVMIFH